jgi:hypothetical protein
MLRLSRRRASHEERRGAHGDLDAADQLAQLMQVGRAWRARRCASARMDRDAGTIDEPWKLSQKVLFLTGATIRT